MIVNMSEHKLVYAIYWCYLKKNQQKYMWKKKSEKSR